MSSDDTYDVVVVGSGAAGMTAALSAAHRGLSVVIVEKAAHYGGSTARSGGGVWIPGNEALIDAGVRDSRDDARAYLKAIVGDHVPAERIDTYVERGPEVVAFVHRTTPLRLRWVPGYSDYYPEAPGGRAQGRSVEPRPFDGRRLGAELAHLEPDYTRAPMNLVVTQADYKWLNLLARDWRGPVRALRVGARMVLGRARRKHLLGRGQALAAGLRAGLLEAGVPVLLDTPLRSVVDDGAGRVTGVVVGEGVTLHARHGVVLAAGGFEHNAEMRRAYQREPIGTEWTNGVPANTGDAITAGMAAGGAVAFMDDAWWGPSIPLPRGAWFCLAERSLPGSIMVNARGERFVNESAPYVEATHAMYGGEFGQGDGPGENIPAWLVFDQRYRNRYMFAGQGPRQALPRRWFEHGCLVRADSLDDLAGAIGVPAQALSETVERFNGFAAAGRDTDFGRGESAYDHYYGDPHNKPNPSLGRLATGPFYAAKMVPGDLGTKGGLVTDCAGRVLRTDGTVVEGLYASGNSSAPVMGHTYAGPGATIGPAMVFAYLAVEDIAHAASSAPAASEKEEIA
ncbi:3-oxosteroid 1-dehydrogenase [Tsukamurella sp. 8F]|uniref:3-oxosteroid 1-dehydrogenase n=1 Tax=unclassified Tsukamurella TaxID=2633480 RepID=UPI0023B89CAD|nr:MULTISPECIES: 3-oxosteroid 1-dehydrogenase [unclassified Tsukamurella]MDF0530711.1 3-oxosteroid 1-dehydrogenase [Tsukamurella sp. 8J]MDF0587912.1 3-oxosteroid 1-dehydrogenase [Tsukamurella sp. 8F]